MPKTLSDLASTHNGFVSPECEIKIKNTNLNKNYIIDDFRLELTAGYEASGLTFTLKNCFDSGRSFTSEMDSSISDILKPGNLAEASIGYAKKEKTKLFNGYIDSIYIDYEGADSLNVTVECLDAKGVMMSSLRSEVKKDVKKYSEAVKNIFDAYSKLITKQSITQSPETSIIEQHNESDYNFVVRAAKKLNYCFYIFNGEAFFEPKGKSRRPILLIKKSDMIKTLSINTSLKSAAWEVIVRSNNEKEPSKPIEGKASSYKSIADGKSVSISNPDVIPRKVVRTIIDHSAASESQAQSLAEAALTELSYYKTNGKMECIGVPELVPGQVIEIDGFGGPCDSIYYIKKATHIIDSNGYVTKCELGANKQ